MSTTEAEVVQPELAPEPPKKSKAIVKRNGAQAVEALPHQPTMEEVLMRAVEQGAPIETMERIFAMIEKAQAIKAEREFNAALTAFQEAMPVIKKKKKARDKTGAERFTYAPIEDILPLARPHLAANGLSVNTSGRVEGERGEKMYVGIAHCKHIGGHTEVREFPVPIILSQYMTDQQSYASASTFAERYAVRKVLGIVTAGDDNEDRLIPNEARAARQPVSQPRQTPTAQKAQEAKANGGQKAQLEPAGEGESIDANTIKGLTAAMEHAHLGMEDFKKRFATLNGLEEVKKTDSRVVMSWIADPANN